MLVIVGGTFTMDPERRDEFLASRAAGMAHSRGEDGCLRYDMYADPTDPGRVVLNEQWASGEALDAHLAAAAGRPPADGPSIPMAVELRRYEVGAITGLRGEPVD